MIASGAGEVASSTIIGLDFDGTVVEHAFPQVGSDLPFVVASLKQIASTGARIVLWTMRSGDLLADAVRWFADRGIPLWGVNSNPDQGTWTKSPKAYCHLYVDDAALGAPLFDPSPGARPAVDWRKAGPSVLAFIEQHMVSRRP